LSSWGAPLYLPSPLLRHVAFKLSRDLDALPALRELFSACARLFLNGDASAWDRAVQMPHYSSAGMPALSLHTGLHFLQLMRSGRFRMLDYGSKRRNTLAYGQPDAPDVAALYPLLRDVQVDLVAGRADGVCHVDDVARHYAALQEAGVKASLRVFDVGHLDVTFAVRDEIRSYVLARLKRPLPEERAAVGA
ncbi:hypothetical protein H632_c2467p1, partial [Helicosporidium sp. ATCC 50920]